MDKKELDRFVDRYKAELQRKKLFKEQQKEKKKFKLNEESIRKIIDNQILPKYKQIRYELYKAKNSNSYYVKLWYHRSYVTARISDHDPYTDAIGSVVDEETTKAEIVSMLKDRIKALMYKNRCHVVSLLKKLNTPPTQ